MALEIALKHALLKKDNLLILADEGDLNWSKTILSKEQQATLKTYAGRKISMLPLPSKERSVYIHFLPAETEEYKAREKTRLAGADMYHFLNTCKESTLVLLDYCKQARALDYLEGMKLSSYRFRKYLSNGDGKQPTLTRIAALDSALQATDLRALEIMCTATFAARDLVNEVPAAQTPELFSQSLEALATQHGFTCRVLREQELIEQGFGGLLAVNRGSFDPPTFNILEWKPRKARNKAPIVLVGKGVVYDTGGLSLKPTPGSMDYMKCDMAGGATVAGSLLAAARMDLPLHIIGLIPATDNRPGHRAFVPGDIIRMYDGKTVEVLNTDAEGRLILADALAYARQYKPELVLDFATLTGAAARAIGPQGIVYMGTADERTKNRLEKCGQEVYERLVEFPLWDEFLEEIKSPIADLKNMGGANAGMITAGKFLEQFTAYPWLHFDIAGPAYLHSASGYRSREGTGVGVRLMFQFLRQYGA